MHLLGPISSSKRRKVIWYDINRYLTDAVTRSKAIYPIQDKKQALDTLLRFVKDIVVPIRRRHLQLTI